MHQEQEKLLCKAIDVLATLRQEFLAVEEQHSFAVISNAIDLINKAIDNKALHLN